MDKVSKLIRDITQLATNNGVHEPRVRIGSFPFGSEVYFRVSLMVGSGDGDFTEILFGDRNLDCGNGVELDGLQGVSLEGILENLLEGMQEHYGEDTEGADDELKDSLQDKLDELESLLNDLESQRDEVWERLTDLDNEVGDVRNTLDELQEQLDNL